MYNIISDNQKRKKNEEEEDLPKLKVSKSSVAIASIVAADTPGDSSEIDSPDKKNNHDSDSDESMITDASDDFQPAEAWNKVRELMLSSTEYTTRDRKEILAQSATFEGLAVLKKLSAKTGIDGDDQRALQAMYTKGKKQLTLYYLVGMYGWSTALHTMKSEETSSLGMPAPILKPASNIIYVKQNHSNLRNYQAPKKKGRPSYRK